MAGISATTLQTVPQKQIQSHVLDGVRIHQLIISITDISFSTIIYQEYRENEPLRLF